MDYNLSYETVESAWECLTPLNKSHHLEISYHSDFKFEPDKASYIAADNAGVYKLFTARVNGKLIGYAGYFLIRHPHVVSVVQANSDIIYIRPDYRKLGIGRAMLDFADKQLKSMGVSIVYLTLSEKLDFSKLITPMGYTPVDRSYARRL
jgi:GNAT superfamily N-acetyltransferase